MSYRFRWLPDVLLNAGLKVAVVPNWETRGHRDVGPTLGVLCHHTAGPRTGNMPSLHTLVEGRRDLPGPLAQLGLGRDGTYYVIAAGMAYHAGDGMWEGISRGNMYLLGIEAENTGGADDPWPEIQLEAYHHGVAAILRHIDASVVQCAGHKEYALPRGRKPDPNLDMVAFRESVARILSGEVSKPAPIPACEPGPYARPTLRRGDVHAAVCMVQHALQRPQNSTFDVHVEAGVRELQRSRGLTPDGIVGPKTWALLDALAKAA